jgi:hypothetical protein
MSQEPEWLVTAREKGLITGSTGVRQSALGTSKPAEVSMDNSKLTDPELIAKLFTSEKHFQRETISLAQSLGWRCAWFRPVRIQRKNGSVYYETPAGADGKGWLDVFMVRGPRAIAAELKFGKNTTTVEQEEWIYAFQPTGVEVYAWYPKDWKTIVSTLTHDNPA